MSAIPDISIVSEIPQIEHIVDVDDGDGTDYIILFDRGVNEVLERDE